MDGPTGMKTITSAAKRSDQKNEYNAFLSDCPSRQLLARISDKWVALVLCSLGGVPEPTQCSPAGVDPQVGREARPLRYSELSRQLAGVSQKMLTQTLRALERDGLIARTVIATVPVTVSYELTPLGRSLHLIVRELKGWAQENMDDVAANRASYDAPAGPTDGGLPAAGR